ncbi:MFS transporter [Granulicoccus phenolivorans]|uniref:MFS transporter n=1 Tax=Granulicoccus phenolivorans TaxID=266854 RepID=UPI000422BBA0|nr:MFS transporter [Granulicoccus phenolivorans]
MTTTGMTTTGQPRKQPSMARVAAATTIGTTIEYFDFFIYGTAAALVFPTVFFPALGAAAGTVASFATFAVAFFARPLGAIIFGHFGDRIGRKRALVTTLLMMGSATVLIGLLPPSTAIGIWAPILLVALRFVQGLAVGGEWAGAALLAAEYAPPKLRGFFSSLPMLGPAIGFGLASATFLVTNIALGDKSDAFVSIGWRVPFVFSALLVLIGLWIRMSIEETPVFRAELDRTTAAPQAKKLPVLEALRLRWKEIVLGGMAFSGLFAFFYIGTSFLTSYGTATLHLPRNEVLAGGIVASVFFAIATVGSGWVCDRVGRKRALVGAGIIGLVWALVMFSVLDAGGSAERGSAVMFTIGLSMTLVVVGFMFGPAGSFLPELFPTRFRYTGAGMAYSLGAILGGAVPPIVAVSIVAAYGGFGVGLMLAGIAAVSVITTIALRETRGSDLDAAEHREPEAALSPAAR